MSKNRPSERPLHRVKKYGLSLSLPVAITKYLRLSSLQRKGLQSKIRQVHTLMISHIQSQQEAEKETNSQHEKWPDACRGLTL